MDQHKRQERWRILVATERLLDPMMVVLGFVWLALLIVELLPGLSPALQRIGTALWTRLDHGCPRLIVSGQAYQQVGRPEATQSR
ncbi:MAG: hypothetical protein ACT443_02435 [Gemmatimonadota bacterium]